MDCKKAYETLIDWVGVDSEALDLVLAIKGYNIETLEAVLFYYTGWGSFEGYLEDMEEFLEDMRES